MSDLYLGLDSSTQSITLVLIESNGGLTKTIFEKSIPFDSEFPNYGTQNGVLDLGHGEVHSPPQIWVEGLDRAFGALVEEGVPLQQLRCIGTSGQQHGSVYLNASAETVLGRLSAEQALKDQTASIYARETSPVWMDSSTSQECAEITESLGGPEAVCSLTGSRAFERFTGPQIRKFWKRSSEAYSQTAHIALVSSFIPSLLAGKIVAIDPGDGAGMNLMDIASRDWNLRALEATAPGLSEKLPSISPSHQTAGTISPYFVKRYGVDNQCLILPGTGDNPSSLIGLGLVSPGNIGISLGTSDTLFAFMSSAATDPTGASHVFGSPTGDYMSLCCYQNGSLARESVRGQFGLDWDEFSRILSTSPPGNQGRIMLPYFDTEIIPRVQQAGVQRFGFEKDDRDANVCAVVEAQMMSMAIHSEWMPEKAARIYVTGGASANRAILQVMADVFEATVYPQQSTSAAAIGAAARAQHAHRWQQGQQVDWETVVSPFVNKGEENAIFPRPDAVRTMQALKEKYREAESDFLKTL